jgi:DNA-binding MarR family transcriptional regulator
MPAWVRVLKFIDEAKPPTQAAIATALQVTRQTVSGHLKILRDKNMLEEDSLALTRSGRKYLKTIHTEVPDDDFEM